MIGLIGATGTVGRHVVRELKTRNAQFRCLVRDTKSAEEILGSDVELVTADIDAPRTLYPALSGCNRLFLLTGHHQSLSSQQYAATDAAKAAGVKQVVKLSAGDAIVKPDSGSQLGVEHWKAEVYLKDSGLNWVMIRPGFFMQNFIAMSESVRRMSSIAMPVPSDCVMGMIDAADIALVAGIVLTEDGYDRTNISIPGRNYRLGEFPSLLSEYLRREVSFHETSISETEQVMADVGMPDWMVRQQIELFNLMRSGAFESRSDQFAWLTGVAYNPLSRFAQDNLDKFR